MGVRFALSTNSRRKSEELRQLEVICPKLKPMSIFVQL